MEKWVRDCVTEIKEKRVIMVVDSWPSFKNHDSIKKNAPNMDVSVMNLPPGTTGNFQPLDAYYFSFMKSFIKTITEFVQLRKVDFDCHKRDNLLKVTLS